jgi:hypothetical protein
MKPIDSKTINNFPYSAAALTNCDCGGGRWLKADYTANFIGGYCITITLWLRKQQLYVQSKVIVFVAEACTS